VASETTAYVGAGVAVGVVAVLGLSRFAADLLYGVKPNDPGNVVLSVAALIMVAALAGVVPSMRAARLDPMRVLREE
jgi:ABC-type antimicrobial peptide transport system permease subunit